MIRVWRRPFSSLVACIGVSVLLLVHPASGATKPAAQPTSAAHSKTVKGTAKKSSSKKKSKATSHSSSGHAKAHGHGAANKKSASKHRGQQQIEPERARAIQSALIREHYMDGEPTGTWDAASQSAMQRFQADNGWQDKNVPDSRALIKLGLGPDHEHLLNPDRAMTTPPELRPQTGAGTIVSSPPADGAAGNQPQ